MKVHQKKGKLVKHIKQGRNNAQQQQDAAFNTVIELPKADNQLMVAELDVVLWSWELRAAPGELKERRHIMEVEGTEGCSSSYI